MPAGKVPNRAVLGPEMVTGLGPLMKVGPARLPTPLQLSVTLASAQVAEVAEQPAVATIFWFAGQVIMGAVWSTTRIT